MVTEVRTTNFVGVCVRTEPTVHVCVCLRKCVCVCVCVLPMRVIVGLVLLPANSRHSERFIYIIGKEHVGLSNTLHTQ